MKFITKLMITGISLLNVSFAAGDAGYFNVIESPTVFFPKQVLVGREAISEYTIKNVSGSTQQIELNTLPKDIKASTASGYCHKDTSLANGASCTMLLSYTPTSANSDYNNQYIPTIYPYSDTDMYGKSPQYPLTMTSVTALSSTAPKLSVTNPVVTFQSGKKTDIAVQNSTSAIANNVILTIPSNIKNYIDTANSTLSCSYIAKGGTCNLTVMVKAGLPNAADTTFAVQGSNTNPLQLTSHIPVPSTTLTTALSTAYFAFNDTTHISVTNSGDYPANDVKLTLPEAISTHLTSGAVTSCPTTLAPHATCTFALPMDTNLTAQSNTGSLTIKGSNTNTLSMPTAAVFQLVSAQSILITKPLVNYQLTLTNQNSNPISNITLTGALPANVKAVSNKCTTTLASGGSCVIDYQATSTDAHGTANLTIGYTLNGVSKSLQTSVSVAKTNVLINPSSSPLLSQDINADVPQGSFSIQNTGTFDWLPEPGSKLSITRSSDDTWLDIDGTGPDACKNLTSLAVGASCKIYYTITGLHDLSSVVTATGINIDDTSQDLEPNANLSIGIEGDSHKQHLTYKAVLVKNLTSKTQVLSKLSVTPPTSFSTKIAVCNPAGSATKNCDTPYESTCFDGANIPQGGSCYIWYHALKNDALSQDTAAPQSAISLTATPLGSQSDQAKVVSRDITFTYGNGLYVGGVFFNGGPNKNLKSLAMWDGTKWHAFNTQWITLVFAMAMHHGDLFMGGYFDSVDNVANTQGLARWNGQQWHGLGGVFDRNSDIESLISYQDNLYVGGTFHQWGPASRDKDYLSRWDGSAWHAVGTGVNGRVSTMTVMNNNLYAGGTFSSAGSLANTSRIARWDGNAWHALAGPAPRNKVNTLSSIGNTLYVGGSFLKAGGIDNANYLASWNGSNWNALGSGVNKSVRNLIASNNQLYASGAFTEAGGVSNTGRLARWDGTQWYSMAFPFTSVNSPDSILSSGPNLYVGGSYGNVNGDNNDGGIAYWNGTSWSTISINLAANKNAILSMIQVPHLSLNTF